MAFYKIRPRSGTTAQWETANTVLGEREIGFEYTGDTVGQGLVKMKMGDGKTPWNTLPYAILDSATATQIKQMLDEQTNILKPIIDGVSNAVANVKGVVDNILSYVISTQSTVGSISSVLGTVNSNVANILNKVNSGTSVIRSIQRGETKVAGNSSTVTISISNVNPDKTIVLFNSICTSSYSKVIVYAYTLTANSVTFIVNGQMGSDYHTKVGYTVIEFV